MISPSKLLSTVHKIQYTNNKDERYTLKCKVIEFLEAFSKTRQLPIKFQYDGLEIMLIQFESIEKLNKLYELNSKKVKIAQK